MVCLYYHGVFVLSWCVCIIMVCLYYHGVFVLSWCVFVSSQHLCIIIMFVSPQTVCILTMCVCVILCVSVTISVCHSVCFCHHGHLCHHLSVGQSQGVYVVRPCPGPLHGVCVNPVLRHVHDDVSAVQCVAECVDRGPTSEERQRPGDQPRIRASTQHVPRGLRRHGTAPG